MSLPMSWISHGTLVLVWFSVRRIWHFLMHVFLDLSSTVADLSQMSVSPPPPSFRLDARISVLQLPLWPDWEVSYEEIVQFDLDMMFVISTFTEDECFQVRETDGDIVMLVAFILVYFSWLLYLVLFIFSPTLAVVRFFLWI